MMDPKTSFQTTAQVFERIRLGITTLETIKEKRWNTAIGKKYAKLLEELVVCFNEKLQENSEKQ